MESELGLVTLPAECEKRNYEKVEGAAMVAWIKLYIGPSEFAGRYKIEEIGPDDHLWRESQEWLVMAAETGTTTEHAIKSTRSSFML